MFIKLDWKESKIKWDSNVKLYTHSLSNITVGFWGEIFNQYEDTRVTKSTNTLSNYLIEQYQNTGLEFINQLNGHFALVIIDKSKNKIICANDRYNTIPIFYAFSSNHKILVLANRIDLIAQQEEIKTSLNWSFVFSKNNFKNREINTYTFAKNIFGLRGGSRLQVDTRESKLNLSQYWKLSLCPSDDWSQKKEKILIEEYRHIIEKAIRQRMTSEESLAITLSGGFDSSLIASYTKKKDSPVFITACTATSLFNHELERAIDITQDINDQHLIVPFSLQEKVHPNDWRKIVELIQHPQTNLESFIKFQTLRQLKLYFPRVQHVLTGYSSDQLNGGTTPIDFTEDMEGFHQDWDSFYHALSNRKINEIKAQRYSDFQKFCHPFLQEQHPVFFELFPIQDYWESYLQNTKRVQDHRLTLFESQACLALHLQFRYPFMDNEHMDFISQIPYNLRSALLFDKQILRKAFQSQLSSTFTQAPKFKRINNIKYSFFNFFKNIIYGENFLLLEQIFEEAESIKSLFDKDLIFGFLKYNEHSPFFPAYSFIVELINIGILDILLQGKKSEQKKDWNFQPKVLKSSEISQEEIELLINPKRYQLDKNKPLKWLKPVHFLKSVDDEDYFLLKDGEIQFQINNQASFAFLNSINGQLSISQLVKDIPIAKEDLDNLLELLFQEGYISNYQIERI